MLSLALWGPYIRLKKKAKPNAIRLDTSYSFSFVDKSLLKNKIQEIQKKYGELPIYDFWGNPVDIDIPLSYSDFHNPMILPNEILISDDYASENLFAIKIFAKETESAILSATIPYVCYKDNICEIEVYTKSLEKQNLSLFFDKKKFTLSVSQNTKKNIFRFLIDANFKNGPLYGKFVLGKGKTPLENFSFMLFISEGLPRGALVFHAPSFLTWQISRRLMNFPQVKIEALNLENFRMFSYRFVVDLTGKISSKKIPVLSLVSYLPQWQNFYAQDLFKENEEIDQILSSFINQISAKPNLFKGTPLAVETPFCTVESVEIIFKGQKLLPKEENQEFCYYFPESGNYTFRMGKDIEAYVGISLAERISLEKKSMPDNENLYWETWEKRQQDILIPFGLKASEENLGRLIFLGSLFLLIFFSWFFRS